MTMDYGSLGYNLILSAHVVSVIAWMAAILYLPRLFVYHVDAPAGSQMSETFKVMERRLLKAIMTPAMLASWVFGLWLAVSASFFEMGWLHAKLALVLAMTAVHGFLAKIVKDFAADRNTRSSFFFRVLNEVPTLFMIAIVVLVVVKPF
jgi:protoporphyrinogen IX oxidase